MKWIKQSLIIVGILAFMIVVTPAVYAQEKVEEQQAEEQEQEEVEQEEVKGEKSPFIEATPEQKRLVRSCIITAARVRKYCRELERMKHMRLIPLEGFTNRTDELIKDTYLLQEHHEKFVSGLSEDQQKPLEKRLERMDVINERIGSNLEKVEEELEKEDYQRTDVAYITEDIEIDVDDLVRIYQGIAAEMGIKLTGY